MQKEVALKILGERVAFSTNHNSFYNYVCSYFKPLIVENAVQGDCVINIAAQWEDDAWESSLESIKNEGNAVTIGAATFMSERKITTVRKLQRKIVYTLELSKDGFLFSSIVKQKKWKDYMRYTVLRKPQTLWFFEFAYPALYYPLFWHFERVKYLHLLHASAFRCKGNGVLVCGLEGMGKTSLALSLLEDDDALFLSDNLVFHDDSGVFPCYEMVRLHAGEDERIWRGRFEKVNDFSTCKDFYRPLISVQHNGIPANVVLFPEFGSEFKIEKLSTDQACRKAVQLSVLAREVEQYLQYRNVYRLLTPEYDPDKAQYRQLEKLFARSTAYGITMCKKDGLERNVERVRELL